MFSASTSFALYRHKSQNLGSAGFAPSTNGGYFLSSTAAHVFGGSLDRDTSRTIPLRFVRLAHSSNFPFASSSRARVELLSPYSPSRALRRLAIDHVRGAPRHAAEHGVTPGQTGLAVPCGSSIPNSHPFARVKLRALGSVASTKQNGPLFTSSAGMNSSVQVVHPDLLCTRLP